MFFLIAQWSLLACKDKLGETGLDSGAERDSAQHQDSEPSSPGDSREGDSSAELVDVVWDEGCNPFSTHESCFFPYPSLHYTSADETSSTGRRLAYASEQYSSPDGQVDFDLGIVNIADGASPLTPVLAHFGVDVGAEWMAGWGDQEKTVLDGAPVALIHAETGESVPILVEMDQANREQSAYDDRHPLILRPLAPMEFGARYFAVITRDVLDSEGASLPSAELFELLRDGVMTSDLTLEEMRPRYEAFFELIETRGWEREEIHLAWDFQVASDQFVLGPARSIRDHISSELDLTTVEYSFDEIEVDPNEHVAWLIRGTFSPVNFLDSDNTLVTDEAHRALPQKDRPSYDFTLTLPPAAREGGDLGLVLIGHGLFGTGASMLDSDTGAEILHPMGDELNAVLVATDWIGMSSGDRDLIIQEILPNIERIRVITDRLVQSHANNLTLVELALQRFGLDPSLALEHGAQLIDPDRVSYYGISLGGIQGASQTALSPHIQRSVLAVPGAGWAHLIQRSTQFYPLELVFDALYPDPLTQSLLLGMGQNFFDWSDPGNLARLLVNQDEGYEQDKTVILQEAIGDCQVANLTTDLLSRAMQARHLEEATDPVFGLETVSSPATGHLLTQIRVPEDLDAYFPEDANVTPETDNGVHNSAVLRENIFEQIRTLYQEGVAVHPCEGPCDPE